MSKFSTPSKGKDATRNYMGGKSFNQSDKEELVFSVVTSFIEDSYYESAGSRLDRIKELVSKIVKNDPAFIAKLAVATRRDFHMRSAYHVLVGELAKQHKCEPNKGDRLVEDAIIHGSERPDDPTEIMAYIGKKPYPNAVKRGVAKAIKKFNGHSLAKYRMDGKKVSLVDVFNLTHPAPEDEHEVDWNRLLSNDLKKSDINTWDARKSSGEDSKKVWTELINKNEIPYMALLRNLRNIVKECSPTTVKKACKIIADPERVKKSKQLPFRFISAYKAVTSTEGGSGLKFEKDTDSGSLVVEALKGAVNASVQNIPLLHGKTVILSDNSGSMHGDMGGSSVVSAASNRTTADIANLFALMYWLRADNTYVGLFGDQLVNPELDREKDIFENFEKVNQAVADKITGGTEEGIFDAIDQLIKSRDQVDRIVIFSDCQVGEACSWYDRGSRHGNDFNKLIQKYRKISPDTLIYSVDLRGYGNTLYSDGVVTLAGWSDKIFELMEMVERKEGLVKWIENYELAPAEPKPSRKRQQRKKPVKK